MKTTVLDHGYIELVESWGSEERIIEAARMSTQKGFLGWGTIECCDCFNGLVHGGNDEMDPCLKCKGTGKLPGDEKLLRYLYENKHASPFEFAGLIIEVQAPIFVFREWHRHRTQSYNEMSARYTPLPDVNYIPTIDRLLNRDAGQAGHPQNKQAGTVTGAMELTEPLANEFRSSLLQKYAEADALYRWALRVGVPKELARVHLPVGRYSRMRASANLRNWLAFLTLREDQRAQYEIRQYASALHGILAEIFPRTMALFETSFR